MKQNYLLSIVGPTGIGKTALSIALAQHYKTEIVSADSRQFFKEMQIGTAAPSMEELNAAPHHFIHHKSVTEDHNVGAFEKEALTTLNQLFKKHSIVIMVGGSGLYIDAITQGLDNFPDVDVSVRENLNERLKNDGLKALTDQLKKLDPDSYRDIAIDNPHRVIRALEICIGTEKPYSSFLNKEKSPRPFKTLSIGLTAERSVIYERINNRVDHMMNNGLFEEVKRLEPFKNYNALRTVGYTELFKVLDNEWNLDFAVSEIKKNSRRYAKRQLTWLRKKDDLLWFDYNTPVKDIVKTVDAEIRNSN